MRDSHVTGCQPFAFDSGFDADSILSCTVIGLQTVGTLEVVSQFASDSAGNLEFASSMLGSLVGALKRGNPRELCAVLIRAVRALFHHIWVLLSAPCQAAEHQELQLFYSADPSGATLPIGPIPISNLRQRYLAGTVDESTLVWTSQEWGGQTNMRRFKPLHSVEDIMSIVLHKQMVAAEEQVIRAGAIKSSQHIGKLKVGERVYIINEETDEDGVVRLEIEMKRGKTGWVRLFTSRRADAPVALHVEDTTQQQINALAEVNAAWQKELESLKLGDLQQRARDEDVDEELVCNALNFDNPKSEIINLIMRPSTTASRQQISAKRPPSLSGIAPNEQQEAAETAGGPAAAAAGGGGAAAAGAAAEAERPAAEQAEATRAETERAEAERLTAARAETEQAEAGRAVARDGAPPATPPQNVPQVGRTDSYPVQPDEVVEEEIEV